MWQFLMGLQFLTRIPITVRWDSDEYKRSIAFFPLVGAVIGLILVILDIGLLYFLPRSIGSVLVITAGIVLTGGMHLDGLGDTADGIFGGLDKKSRLEIMRDSNIGIYALLAVVSAIALKISTLAYLPFPYRIYALIIGPTLGKWGMVYSSLMGVYPRKEGLGKVFTNAVGAREISIATVTSLLITIGLLGVNSVPILTGTFLSVFFGLKFFLSRIGGVTGDTHGAMNEIIEILTMLVIAGIYFKTG